MSKGNRTEGARLFEEALAINERTLGPRHPAVAQGLINLGNIYSERDDYKKAEPLLLRGLDILETALGPEHPDTVTALNKLASFYRIMGDAEKAAFFEKKALDRQSGFSPSTGGVRK